MFKLRPIVLVLGAGLLQACAAPPAKQELTMEPVLRVRHSSDQAAATYYQLGKYHQERGNLDLARAAYNHSIALDSRPLEARNALASIHSLQGRLDEARALLLQLVADYPALAHLYNNLGYVYYLQSNYEAAVTALQRALLLDSGNERARNNLETVQVAVASHGERATVALGLAPEATIASPPAKQLGSKLDEPAASSASAPQVQGLAIISPPSEPQTRMEVVQIVPNVYELRLKQPVASVLADLQIEKTVAAVATPTPALALATKTARVEIANGNGVAGMARRISRVVGQHGIAVSRLTNERPYKQQDTKIQYRVGHEQAAEALKHALRGHAVVVPVNSLSGNSDVRLVLGRDAIAHLALIEGSASESLLAFNQKSN